MQTRSHGITPETTREVEGLDILRFEMRAGAVAERFGQIGAVIGKDRDLVAAFDLRRIGRIGLVVDLERGIDGTRRRADSGTNS